MSDFNEREQAYEKKFSHDNELEFKITSRAAYLLGQWAAKEMGLAGADAEAYARQAVEAETTKPGHDDLYEKIEKDFAAKNVSHTRHRLERELAGCTAKAREQLSA